MSLSASAFPLRVLGVALGLWLLATDAVWGQGGATGPEVAGPVYAHALPEAPRSPARVGAPVRVTARGAAATFEVSYVGFPEEAQEAFQRAVDLWAGYVVSSVPIRIEASWVEFDSDRTLGAAGPLIVNFGTNAPAGIEANTWYPIALANALLERDVDEDAPDIEAEFNADFTRWHFGEDAPGPNAFDFTTVVLHELAHGLGFIGAFTVDNGLGTIVRTQNDREPFAFDLLAQDCRGNAALNAALYPRPSEALEALLTSQALYVAGPRIDATVIDPADESEAPVPLYAPGSWNPGSSYSHFDEATFPAGTPQSLMTPFFEGGERVLTPGALTCALLADLGWTLSGDCVGLVDGGARVDIGGDACAGTNPPEPQPPVPNVLEPFRLDELGPTIVRAGEEPRFALFFGSETTVNLRVYDALGRLRLWRRLAGASQTVIEGQPVGLASLGLAAGTYFVVFEAAGELHTEQVVVLR